MIGVEVAQQLKEAGLTWKPASGDRFAIPDRDLDDEVFVLSNMTIEVYNVPDGRVIGFNGTTEWALDDVEIERGALAAPRGPAAGTPRRHVPDAAPSDGRLRRGDRPSWARIATFSAPTPEEAYAAALLHLLAAAT